MPYKSACPTRTRRTGFTPRLPQCPPTCSMAGQHCLGALSDSGIQSRTTIQPSTVASSMFSGRHGPNGWNNARRSGRRTSQLASQSQAKSSNPERSRSVPSVGIPRGSNERSRGACLTRSRFAGAGTWKPIRFAGPAPETCPERERTYQHRYRARYYGVCSTRPAARWSGSIDRSNRWPAS